ncbi:hypothetical protein L204_100699 [Cryptococcus depauperatus]
MAHQPFAAGDVGDSFRLGAFKCLLPMVDEILGLLHSQTTSSNQISPAQTSEHVAPKAKELAQALEGMKEAVMSLPGGHLATEEINEMIDILDEEGDKRRRVLRRLESLNMPLVEEMGQVGAKMRTTETAVFPTPKREHKQ